MLHSLSYEMCDSPDNATPETKLSGILYASKISKDFQKGTELAQK